MELMILNFIFSNANVIMLGIWVLFLLIVAIRFLRPGWVKNISYQKLVLIDIFFNIFYGAFLTWGQYYVWANTTDSRASYLINSPLSKDTPILGWLRPLFENHLGYFMHYAWTHFWLNIFISLVVSGALYILFKVWRSYRGNFLPEGPEILLILMLACGWPGLIILIPLGFLVSFVGFFIYELKGKKLLYVEPMFIIATFLTIIFEKPIFNLILKLFPHALHL